MSDQHYPRGLSNQMCQQSSRSAFGGSIGPVRRIDENGNELDTPEPVWWDAGYEVWLALDRGLGITKGRLVADFLPSLKN